MKLKTDKIRPIIEEALHEDIGDGDITTGLLIPTELESQAVILTREESVVCGLPIAEMIFKRIDPHLKVELLVKEGDHVRADSDLLIVTGRAGSILTAERTVLNFMQRLCGIASLTASYVEKVKLFGTLIMDTRKTTPNMRILEKYAVRVGGGHNHRKGLYDAILIKENHLAMIQNSGQLGIASFVKKARERYPKRWVEIEVEDLEYLKEVIEAEPDAILLDNFTPEQLHQAVEKIRDKIVKEASGNVSLNNIEEIAASGVDRISIGRLTHSVRSIDLALEFLEDDDHAEH